MQLFLDDANLEAVRSLFGFYPLDGVTTNPGILAKAGGNPRSLLSKIREEIGEENLLFAQVVADSAEGMLEDARRILRWIGEKNTVIKIPVTENGIRAIRILSDEGISVCGTVVFTSSQALLAAKAGAVYVAPYVNRIENLGIDGVAAAAGMQSLFERQGCACSVLGASFKNARQVMELYANGIPACTAPADLIRSMACNASASDAIKGFHDRFAEAFGGAEDLGGF